MANLTTLELPLESETHLDAEAEAESDVAERVVDSHDSSGEDGLPAYLREIRRAPLLTAAEEVDLAKRVEAGDEEAKQRFIVANLRLVVEYCQEVPGARILAA